MKPAFLIIGAMKSATTTLFRQLSLQEGIHVPKIKEPAFFNDDGNYRKGWSWYQSLFDAAGPGEMCGEASTEYTKLPTYPGTVERILQHLPGVKLIYVMRHPVDRLVSHYIHEWTERKIRVDLDRAIEHHPELISYGLYARQLKPYLEAFGSAQVLPVFFDKLLLYPQQELERVCRFIGVEREVHWHRQEQRVNESSKRLRKSPWRDALVYAPLLSSLRKHLIPRALRERVKALWRMKDRPCLSDPKLIEVMAAFDADLQRLGRWLDQRLTCQNFVQVCRTLEPAWDVGAVPRKTVASESTVKPVRE